MELPEDQASQIQVWSLPDYLNVHGTKMPDGAYGANLDEAWRQFYASHPDSFYSRGKDLLTEEFNRTLNHDLSVKMAQKAIDAIQRDGIRPKIEDGPMIYVARYGTSYALDAMCQVSINKQFDPGSFEPNDYRGKSFLRKLGMRTGIIRPKKTTALTVRLYADADYLDGAYTQGKGYEDVRGRVFAAMVARSLRDCEDPEYVETYIMFEDDIAKSRFATLGELKQGGVHRQVVAEGLDGIPPISRRFAHYAVKNPGLGIAA